MKRLIVVVQPFGRSLMTIVLPQLRHGDSDLVIWSLTNNSEKQPVHEFTGFTDILLEFHWRPVGKGGRCFLSS